MAEMQQSTPQGAPQEPPEVIVIEGHRVSCDGGGGVLGHPKVWLELGEHDYVECGYCDRRFVRKGSAHDPTAST